MREILFRGKRTDGTGWIEGFYFQKSTPNSDDGRPVYHGITDLPPFDAEVIPETVGQYTGLKDTNKKRIFEGDIVQVWWNANHDEEPQKYKAIIEFGNPNCELDWGWQLLMLDYFPFNKSILLWIDMEESGAYCEVVGNIHDNPELLSEVEG